jgi:hypothetical protein
MGYAWPGLVALSLLVAAPAFGQDNVKTFTYTKTKQAELEILCRGSNYGPTRS